MTLTKKLAVIAELNKRRAESEKPSFSFYNFAFEKQVEFFKNAGPRFRTAVCSRRAGKTVGVAADLIDTCLNEPSVTCLYITITKDNVRRIIWSDIQKIIEDYKIPCKMNNLLMEIKFPNGSRIITGGSKDKSEIEKFRGLKLKKVYIDEVQSMRDHIRCLIDDIIIPALRDLRGSIFLIGTPGPVKAGVFYDYSHNKAWHNIKWDAFDNPHMHNPSKGLDLEETLREERHLRGIDETNASYIRETYGTWIEDTESLVIKYNEDINHYDELPATGLIYILGVDIGFEDSDAIAVLAYSMRTNQVFVVEEVEKNKQDITELAEEIKKLQKKYSPVKIVIDAGALGKKIQEELRLRHQLPIEAADKNRKFEYLEFMNADLRKGILKARKDSLFAQDSKLVTWDRTDKEKLKISNIYHSDIMDAVLYAYRVCMHYIKEDVPIKLDKNTDAFMDALELQESEELKQKAEDPESYEYNQLLDQEARDFDEEDWI